MSSAPLTPFADSGGLVHFFDGRFPEKGTVSRRPEDLFSESEFYAQYDCRGGRLETPHSLAREVPGGKETWDRYLFSHFANLRDDLVPFFEENLPERIFRVAEEARPELPVWNDEVRLVFQEEVEKAEERLKEEFPFCLLKSDGEVLRMLESWGLCIAAIPGPRKSFVLGNKSVSSPTRFYSYGDTELCLLAPDSARHSCHSWIFRRFRNAFRSRVTSRLPLITSFTHCFASFSLGKYPTT